VVVVVFIFLVIVVNGNAWAWYEAIANIHPHWRACNNRWFAVLNMDAHFDQRAPAFHPKGFLAGDPEIDVVIHVVAIHPNGFGQLFHAHRILPYPGNRALRIGTGGVGSHPSRRNGGVTVVVGRQTQ
jgi:hypothetical protein